jgi:hypothetical protein
VIHASVSFDDPPAEPLVAAPVVAPALDEAVVMALGVTAQAFEPASPPGSWRLVWKGRPADLLAREVRAEALPGGYVVTSMVLHEQAPDLWSLETVLSPWREGLTSPPPGQLTDVGDVARRLGWVAVKEVVPLRRPPVPVAPVASAPVPAAPVPLSGDLLLLGSYGDGAGRHWWLKETATDRVFEVPGAPDWSLDQADGAGLVVRKAGRLYRVELGP